VNFSEGVNSNFPSILHSICVFSVSVEIFWLIHVQWGSNLHLLIKYSKKIYVRLIGIVIYEHLK